MYSTDVHVCVRTCICMCMYLLHACDAFAHVDSDARGETMGEQRLEQTFCRFQQRRARVLLFFAPLAK